MKRIILLFNLILLIIFSTSCTKDSNTVNGDTSQIACIDIQGNKYKTIKIGNQIWMAENLNVGYFIKTDNEQIQNGILEKYCYENDSTFFKTEGGLYMWSELFEKDFCPKGWRLPTENDWKELMQFLGSSTRGDRLRADGDVGFNCNYSGSCWHGQFDGGGLQGCYWTTTEVDSKNAKFFLTASNCPDLAIHTWTKNTAISVRCIKE